MANKEDTAVSLSPKRNQTAERKKLFEEMLLKEIPGFGRVNEPMHAVLENELGENVMVEGRAQIVRNHALIHYLATLANSNSTDDTFDFDFIESLLSNGADINSTDKSGQTVFHEVARSWNIDVAIFLIKHGANVNQQDQYGRSPLHVAAAVDYAEMVEFLLQNGADIDIKTTGEGQEAIHFAAKNDAINSLQMLLGYGANIDARDSKNRTPLQVSAEMNRSKAAKLLITEGAPAGVNDNLGNSALSLLIEKIPEVALDAMDQLHSVDTINRKEFYFLNYLEEARLKEKKTPARTPLEIAVQNERFDIIMHPIMQRLISVKWEMYGKRGAVLDLVVNLVYTLLWTVLAVTLPTYGRDLYLPIGEKSWRLIIGIFLILFTILEIRKQILNTTKTRHELKQWREWRAAELERDLAYCHPRWPQETQYLKAEIKAVRNLSLISGSDWWIYFDWASLVLIMATITSHVTFFQLSNDTSKQVHHYITIPLLLILWFRILKYARPFEGAGPFVVIFGNVMNDIVKWALLTSVIVIPFTCAFWITFGATSLTPAKGYNSVGPLIYNIFSMMIVSSHGYDELEKANPVMARILCGSFIGIAAIVTLNLLIALLTNTFERLYQHAVENAVMQRARTILLLQKSLRKKQKQKYYDFIRNEGSPQIIVKTLGRLLMMDGDDHVTIERLRDDVKTIVKILGEKFGKKFGKGNKSDLDWVKIDVSKIRRFQEELVVDVKNMKHVLQEITEKVAEIGNTEVGDMLHEMMGKLEEINKNNNNNNNANNKGNSFGGLTGGPPKNNSIQKSSEKCSKENSSTGSSGSKTDSDSSTKHKREGCEIKFKETSSGQTNSRKRTVHEGSSEISKKHKKDYKKQQEPDTASKDSHIPHRQLGYPPKEDRQNGRLPFGVHIPQPMAYNQRNTQQFEARPTKSGHQPRDFAIQNPLLAHSFDQRFPYSHIPSFDHLSPNLRQPSNWDLQQNSPNASRYPSHRNENRKPVQSSTHVGQPTFTKSNFQQPPKGQNTDTTYAYLNYGYQPIVQDIYQSPSGVIGNQQLLHQNMPILSHTKIEQGQHATPSINQRSTFPDFIEEGVRNDFAQISQLSTSQNKDKPEQADRYSKSTIFYPETVISQTTGPKINEIEKSNAIINQADESLLIPVTPTSEEYNQHYFSFPYSPEIFKKVAYFEEKISEKKPQEFRNIDLRKISRAPLSTTELEDNTTTEISNENTADILSKSEPDDSTLEPSSSTKIQGSSYSQELEDPQVKKMLDTTNQEPVGQCVGIPQSDKPRDIGSQAVDGIETHEAFSPGNENSGFPHEVPTDDISIEGR